MSLPRCFPLLVPHGEPRRGEGWIFSDLPFDGGVHPRGRRAGTRPARRRLPPRLLALPVVASSTISRLHLLNSTPRVVKISDLREATIESASRRSRSPTQQQLSLMFSCLGDEWCSFSPAGTATTRVGSSFC